MATLQNGDIAQQNITAVLKCDCFVADASLFGREIGIVAAVAPLPKGKSLSMYQAGPKD